MTIRENLNLYRNDQEMIVDAFDRIVVELFKENQVNGYKTFLICSCNAGVGSTSISMELAISLSVAGWRTVLIDGDLRKERQYKRLNQKVEAGLSDYIIRQLEPEDILYPTNWPGLQYIACGHQMDETPVKLLCSQRMGELISYLKANYDFVLFDLPALNSVVDAAIVGSKTDCAFLVTASGETKFRDLETAKKQLEEAGANLLGVILNKVSVDDYQYYMQDYNYFSDKEYLKRGRYFRKNAAKEKPTFRKAVAGFFKKLMFCLALCCLFGIRGVSSPPMEALAQSTALTGKTAPPVVMVESYQVDGTMASGNEFAVSFRLKNMDAEKEATNLKIVLHVISGGLYFVEGETNQQYLERLGPGETGDCVFTLKAVDGANDVAAALELDLDYMSEAGAGSNTIKISPSMDKACDIDVISITTPERAVIGASALFSIQYENIGTARPVDLKLRIQGNIVSNNEEILLQTPDPGRQAYMEKGIVFTDDGTQELTVYISYKDRDGVTHELSPQTVVTEVTNSSNGRSVYGTDIAWDEKSRHLVKRTTFKSVMQKIQKDYGVLLWAAAFLLLANCLRKAYQYMGGDRKKLLKQISQIYETINKYRKNKRTERRDEK